MLSPRSLALVSHRYTPTSTSVELCGSFVWGQAISSIKKSPIIQASQANTLQKSLRTSCLDTATLCRFCFFDSRYMVCSFEKLEIVSLSLPSWMNGTCRSAGLLFFFSTTRNCLIEMIYLLDVYLLTLWDEKDFSSGRDDHTASSSEFEVVRSSTMMAFNSLADRQQQLVRVWISFRCQLVGLSCLLSLSLLAAASTHFNSTWLITSVCQSVRWWISC